MLYVRMAISMLVGLYTSRVVLYALGVTDYGIYNVVGGLTTMFMFLNSSMAVSTSRFLTYELGRNDSAQLSLVYKQAIIIHVIIAVCIFILIETVGLWFLHNKLVIPEGRMYAAEWILHTVAAVSVLNILSTPDMSLIIAYERMSSFAYISLFDVFFKLTIAILLVYWGGDKLILYAILLMFSQLVVRLIYYIYSKIVFKELHGKLLIEIRMFKEMVSFAGWNLLGNLALMTIDQGVNILLNVFCGPVVNAARGVSTQVSNHVNAFVMNIRMAINPQITKSFSAGNLDYMHTLIKYSSLSCYYLLLIVSIPLFWVTDCLLSIWLVEVPPLTGTFFRLTLAYIMANSFANPIIIGIHSTGNIVKFQVVEGILMLLTLPLAWIFLHCGYPPFWVYIAQITIAIVSQIGRLYVVLPAIKMKLAYYLNSICLPCLWVTIASVLLPLLIWNLYSEDETLLFLMLMAAMSFVWTALSIYVIGLNKTEKQIVKRAASKFLNC